MIADDQPNYSFDPNEIRIDYTTLTPRFSVVDNQSLDEGIRYLAEHGYAVFSDVMNQEEINHNKDLLWKFLENIPHTRIDRNNPSTWSKHWPGNGRYGILNDCGIGQSDFMWSVRSNRNIKHVYSRIWNADELLVSFDGCGLFRNWYLDSTWKTLAGWYHTDQNPGSKPDRCCVQGFVALTEQNEKTGGLIVFPQTHLRFHELTNLVRNSKDFIRVPSTHPIFDGGRAIGRLIQAQAGDLIVWDSRIIHSNAPSFVIDENLQKQSIDFLRIVAYVSMSPTSFVRGQTLDQFRKKRKLLAQNNCTLTHWSTDLVESSSSANLPKVSLKKLTSYQRSLIIGTNLDDDNNE